ncbi:MAG: trypsin-like peptidase domain-containing protein [Candidatus Methanomethylicia archaeon]|nr:trypsin-like peptidase domain-containing protein [Candidatus Methanomethylicia archaeon]
MTSSIKDFNEHVIKIIENVSRGVVTITTVRIGFETLFGMTPIKGLGSGFLISDNIIVTNAHVVANARAVDVIFSDGSRVEGRVLIADSYRDVALVRVYNVPSSVKLLPMGNSDELKIGEIVFAVGSPLGLPGPTVTMGVVSAVGRNIVGQDVALEDLIQTDAAINPGNSGGPLINVDGRVIGMVTAIIPYAQGIGFAIPINTVKRVLEMIETYGRPVRAMIGVYATSITPQLASAYRLPLKRGLLVVQVIQGTPAHEVRLAPGDIITKIAGKEASDVRELRRAVEDSIAQGYIELEVYRSGYGYRRVKVPIMVEEIG